MDDYGRDFVERDEKRLTELGRRTVEMYVTAGIVTYLQVSCLQHSCGFALDFAVLLNPTVSSSACSSAVTVHLLPAKVQRGTGDVASLQTAVLEFASSPYLCCRAASTSTKPKWH